MRRFEPGSRRNAIFAGGLTLASWRGCGRGLDGASQHETLDTTGSPDCQGTRKQGTVVGGKRYPGMTYVIDLKSYFPLVHAYICRYLEGTLCSFTTGSCILPLGRVARIGSSKI